MPLKINVTFVEAIEMSTFIQESLISMHMPIPIQWMEPKIKGDFPETMLESDFKESGQGIGQDWQPPQAAYPAAQESNFGASNIHLTM